MAIIKLLHSPPAIAIRLTLLALAYYSLLACCEYTWIFVSGDSGDWLASARIWFVPQPYGSPLYILLAKLVALVPTNLAASMTLLLSSLPAAITVGLTYLAARKLTGRDLYAIGAALVVWGASIFTTQATVVEEYALTTMFLTAAWLGHLYKKPALTLSCLGLASAIHIIAVLITGIYLVFNIRDWRTYLRLCPYYLVTGVLPYALIIFLMEHAPYRWFANGFSLGMLNSYLGSTQTIGSLAIVDAPLRLLQCATALLGSFGLALIPALKAARSQILFSLLIVVLVWLYVTDIDPTTWTFMCYATPLIAILAALGMAKLTPLAQKVTIATTICLIIANGFCMNANLLNSQQPIARTFYEASTNLPDNSLVVTSQGGFYTLGLFHVIAEGKDIELCFIVRDANTNSKTYQGWLEWANQQSPWEMIEHALASGRDVFFVKDTLAIPPHTRLTRVPYNDEYDRITGVTND